MIHTCQGAVAETCKGNLPVPDTCRAGRILCLVLMACLLLVVCSVSGLGPDNRVIIARGDANYPPYEFIDATGQPAGWNIDLLNAVAETEGLNVSIRLGPWNEIRSELETGKIDLALGMFHSPERAKTVLFSTPHLVQTQALFVRKGSGIRSLADLSNKTILVQNRDINFDFLSGAAKGYTVSPVTNQSDALTLLAAGQGDAAIVTTLTGAYVIRTNKLTNIEQVGPPLYTTNYCFAISPNNSALRDTLNEGLAIVKKSGKYDQLYQKWFGTSPVSASDESVKKIILVRGDENFPPYEYLDENGQPAGFSIEIFRAVADSMGLDYNLTLGPWSEVRQDIESGRIDMVTDAAITDKREGLMDFSAPYDTKSAFLYVRKGSSVRTLANLEGKQVLVEKGDIAEDFLRDQNLTAGIVPFSSKSDAILALSEGKGDAAILLKHEGYLLTDRFHITNVEPAGSPLYQVKAGFAVRKGDAALLARLNEGLAVIKQSGEYDRIYNKWFGAYEERSFFDQAIIPIIAIAIFVLLIFGIITAWNWSLKRQVAIKTAELKKELSLRTSSEQSLKQSERQLAEIIDFLPDATLVIDRSGKVIAWNRAMEEMTGVPAEQMLGKGDYEYAIPFYGIRRPILVDLALIPNEQIEREYYHIIQKMGDIIVAETDLPSPQGKIVTLWGKATPLYNEKNEKMGAIESIRDVTDRKRAEQQIADHSRFLTTLIDTLPVPLFYKDVYGKYLGCNLQFEEYIGIPRGELIGKTVYDISPNDLADRYQKADQELYDNPGPQNYETQVVFANGSRHDVIFYKAPFFNQDGTVSGLIGTFLDITDRKTAECALEDAKEFAENVIETANAIIVGLDQQGNITIFNNEAERVTGYSRVEMLTRNWFKTVVPADRFPFVHEEFGRLMTGGMPKYFENPILTKNGEVRYISWKNNEIRKQEQVIGTISFGIDITERKIAEDELRVLYADLEQRVADRTADLHRAEEGYRHANEKLNLLSSITRHDILNQLMVLKGFLALSEQMMSDNAAGGYIQKANSAAATIERHIVFTRLYQDIGVKSPHWQNVRQCAEKQVGDILPASVTFVADTEGIEIYADPLCEKVLYTLMDNSLRHGERVTEIRMSSRETGSGDLVLVYEDNGVGVRAGDKGRIFERGFGKNTGFGLFLAREILAITDITITETGTEGKGARFEMTVPKGAWRNSGERDGLPFTQEDPHH